MGSTLIDAGTNPTLPVNTEAGAGGTLIQITRPRRRGTADYDSGIVAIASPGPGVITASTVYPEGGYIVNTGDTPILATLTDTSGAVFYRRTIEGRDTQPIPVGPGCSFVGVKASADAAGLSLHLFGGQ